MTKEQKISKNIAKKIKHDRLVAEVTMLVYDELPKDLSFYKRKKVANNLAEPLIELIKNK